MTFSVYMRLILIYVSVSYFCQQQRTFQSNIIKFGFKSINLVD